MDVNNTTTQLSGAAGKLAPLAERIMKRADVNRDGNVTSAEFADFLAKLTASIQAELPAARKAQTTTAAAPPTAAAPVPSGTISAARAALLQLVASNLPKDR